MTIFFKKMLLQKYPNKALRSQSWTFFFLHEILQLNKIKGADFKYEEITDKIDQTLRGPIADKTTPKQGICTNTLLAEKLVGVDFN